MNPPVDNGRRIPATTRVLRRFTFLQRLTAIAVVLAVCVAATPRRAADDAAASRDASFAAAKAAVEFTLNLPDGRGRVPLAAGGTKLLPVFVFCGGASTDGARHALAPAATVSLFRSAPVLRPRLVGTVELRI